MKLRIYPIYRRRRSSACGDDDDDSPQRRKRLCLILGIICILWMTKSWGNNWINPNNASSIIPGQQLLQRSKESKNRKCALLFFGLPRVFRKLVLPSLKANVFPYTAECDIYVHTYNITWLTNTRNAENGPVDVFEIYDMNPTGVVMETEEQFLAALPHNLSWYAQYNTDEWKQIPTMMPNMLRQWNSIEKVWNLMESSGYNYDYVGMLRSDVFYATPFKDVLFTSTAAIPDFANFPTNDRGFYGTYEQAKIWSTARFPNVDEYFANQTSQGIKPFLHSETFMYSVIVPRLTKNLTRPNICFWRVRQHGVIQHWDCSQPEDVMTLLKNITGLDCPNSKCPI